MKNDQNRRVTKELVTTVVDTNTGEHLETRDIKEYSVPGEPDYVKLYLKDISRIYGLPPGCSSVMYELLSRMDYDNLIAITPPIRKVIAAKSRTSVDVINHAIAKLVAEGVFTKIGSGTYMANPDLFARGKWVDIRNLRLCITYDNNGRTFKCSKNVPEQLSMELDVDTKPISGVPAAIFACR